MAQRDYHIRRLLPKRWLVLDKFFNRLAKPVSILAVEIVPASFEHPELTVRNQLGCSIRIAYRDNSILSPPD